jgi:hypothetical protein
VLVLLQLLLLCESFPFDWPLGFSWKKEEEKESQTEKG